MPSLAWRLVIRIPRVLSRRLSCREAPRLPASTRHEGGYQSGKGHPPSLRENIWQRTKLAAAMAHAFAIGLTDRLVGLNRKIVGCDLKRLGGFYRFCVPSLGQYAHNTARPERGRPESAAVATAIITPAPRKSSETASVLEAIAVGGTKLMGQTPERSSQPLCSFRRSQRHGVSAQAGACGRFPHPSV